MQKKNKKIKNILKNTRRSILEENVLSYSKVSQYMQCPYLYYKKYILHEFIASSKNMNYGSDVHKICETMACHDISPEYVKSLTKGQDKQFQDRAMKYGEFLSGAFLAEPPEFHTVLDITPELKLELHIDLAYFLDDGTLVISDVKTSPNTLGATQLEYDFQLSGYAWAYLEYLKQHEHEYQTIVNLQDADTRAKQVAIAKLKVIRGQSAVKLAIWSWFYSYMIYSNKYIDINALEGYEFRWLAIWEEMKGLTPDRAWKQNNEWCGGCPEITTCHACKIPKSLNGLRSTVKKLEKQIEILEGKYLEELSHVPVIESPRENGQYYLSKTDKTVPNLHLFYSQLSEKMNNINIDPMIKNFIKPTYKAMEAAGMHIEKEVIGYTVSVDFRRILPKKKESLNGKTARNQRNK